MELPAVAKSFYAFCKKCDSERFHKVLAHTGPKSAKIQCEVCGSSKKFTIKVEGAAKRAPAKPRGETAAKAAESRKRLEHESNYNDLATKFASQSPTRYTVKGQFGKDTVIEHPQFGLGFVMFSSDAKIDVVFKDSIRSLIHRRV